MNATIQSIGLYLLTTVGLIAAAVIAAVGHPVPDQLWTIDTVLVGAAAGVTIPALSTKAAPPAGSATYTPPPAQG